jgi:hypothetical protein
MTGEKDELSPPAPTPRMTAAAMAAGRAVVRANAMSATPLVISEIQKICAGGTRLAIGPVSS